MRRVEPWLVVIALVMSVAGAANVAAQPAVRDHRNPPPPPQMERDHRRLPPGAPSEPPPPQAETPVSRPGFVWIPGRWDWRGKWQWVPGHAERERAGKKWRDGRWEHQGDTWVYSDGGWADAADAPPGGDAPHQPPPPPRGEDVAVRPGFAWLPGRWDWRGGKWEWVAGHWERERAGKHWNVGHWDKQGDRWAYVEGTWGDGALPPSPPPPPPPPRPDGHDGHDRHHEWKLDRPVVSSYWPVKGKTGGRVVIRGRNFPGDTTVLWGGSQINGAKVSPEQIVVAVPPGAASGMIALHTGRGRDLMVGNFEVADYDAAAEAKRLEDQARKRAEQDWADRQKQLAKDRAARAAAADKHRQELEDTREQRRADRLREIRGKWEAAFLADTDTQAELTLHAQRVAELDRMREVAELSENGKLVVRIGVAQTREDERHQSRMATLHDMFGRKP